MRERTYTIKGVSPLVMHNEQLADPLNRWTRALKGVSKKRTKTDDDLLEMSRIEWMGGLYWDESIGIHVPERCLERMLRDAAAKTKRGKDVVSGLIVVEPASLVYKGPKVPAELWEMDAFRLRASVGVQKSRVIRTRPIFREWALSFTVNYDENVLDPGDIDGFLDVAGRLIGLLDWRPKHGRFIVEAVK